MRTMNADKFTQKAIETIQTAQSMAQENGNQYLTPEHLLYALIDQDGGLIGSLLGRMGVDCDTVLAELDTVISQMPKVSGGSGDVYASPETGKVLAFAERTAKNMNDEYLSVEHLMLGIFAYQTSAIKRIFNNHGITKDGFTTELSKVKTGRVTSDNPESTYDALKKYGTDLVERAREGKMDPVIGRDQEIRNVIRILSRKTKNNPVLIGEPGTGKEQIARAIYLRGPLVNSPLVVVDCTLMDDKNWDYLLGHHASPLNDSGSTIYFQHLEDLPATRQSELLSLIQETGMTKRVRLIFSCNCLEGAPVPEVGRMFVSRLGCLALRLPTLRSRSDEIPSLASLYLGSLNLELDKQISGFDPHAVELLRQYDWPHNYTQFKQVLHELATLATSSYIRSSAVAELLAKQRAITRGTSAAPQSGVAIEGRTLEEITREVIEQSVAAHGGNQTAAARALGISRTTLWRVLGKEK